MDVDFLSDDPLDDIRSFNETNVCMNFVSERTVPASVQCLPYRCQTQTEYESLLEQATKNICTCIDRGIWGSTMLEWCQHIRYLFALKYPISRSLRVRMARLFYEIAVMPKLDASLTDMAATLCVHLLRPKKEISYHDLELPWRSLYDALDREVHQKYRKIGTSAVAGVLLDLAEASQRFFPASEATAMLETMLPHFDGHDLNSVISTQALLVHFLPLSHPDAWLPTLFRLWETFKSALFDDQMLDLLAQLAELHVTDPQPTTHRSDTGVFTDEQFALIMTKCLRSAGLPVSVNKTAKAALMAQSSSVRTGADATASQKTLRMKKPSDRLHSFAVIIVYSIAYDGDDANLVGGSKALTQLAQFVQATETFFHPSNWGPWQAQLSSFVQHLTWEYAKRQKAEERQDCRTPVEWRLTPANRREFVKMLRTVSLLGMFSKDAVTSLSSQSSLKRMAFLQPELVLPAILQRGYNSLESLETTQRTGAVISALATTSQPLLSRTLYPAGAKHMAPILHLCLPGIDLNDPIKTMGTCMLILSASVSLIISDASMNEPDQLESESKSESEGQRRVQVDENTESTVAAEEYAARLSTADIDSWSVEFVHRVLALITALPDEGKGGKIGEKNEEAVLNMLIATCDAFCSALGEEAFGRCLEIVLDYVRTTTAANGVKVIGSLVGCFARANSEKVLAQVVPMSCKRIEHELQHGASSIRTTSTSVPRAEDTALHWHINVLSSAVMFAGPALLQYRTEILATMTQLIHACKTERAYVLHAKFVQRVLSALVNVYAAEQRCLNPREWDSDMRRHHPHRLFGRVYELEDVEITWHVPSSAEIDMALDVLTLVVGPVLDALDALLSATQHDDAWHNDVCRYLHVMRYALAGQSAMITDQSRRHLPQDHCVYDDLGDIDASACAPPLDMNTGAVVTPDDPRYAHVVAFRERVGTVLERAAEVVSHLSADHVDAVKQVVRALRTYLVPHSAHTDEVQGLSKSVGFFRTIGRRFAKQRRFPRILWIRRAMLYHVTRQRLQSVHLAHTARDRALMMQLERLCTSHYIPVRRLAQSALESVFGMYRGTRWLCLPTLLEQLAPSASDEQVKGALYVLGMKSFLRTCARNPRFTRPVLMAMFRLQSRARPSIQKLVRGVLSELVARMSDSCVHEAYFCTDALRELAASFGSDLESGYVDTTAAKLQSSWLELVRTSNEALQSDLLAMLHAPQTHWAFAQLALRALRAVLRRDTPVRADIAERVAQLAISDDPDLRVYAQSTLVRMLYLAKLQTFSRGQDLYLECMHQPLKRQERTAASATASMTKPERAAMFHEPLTASSHLYDKDTDAWLVQPTVDTYYVVGPAPPLCATSQRTVDAIARVVSTPAWWDAFARHVSLEMDRDYMAADTTLLVKSLFQAVGPALLEHVKPVIEANLVSERDRHKHRAAAEISGGIVRGAKHWSLASHEALHAWLDSWLARAMCECTMDSQPAWQMWVEYVFQYRDPRRMHALLTFVWSHACEALRDERRGPGQQAHAQQLLASALHALQSKAHGWDAKDAADMPQHPPDCGTTAAGQAVRMKPANLADTLQKHFAHDYQEVRKAVCETLVEWEWTFARPALPSTTALLEQCRCTTRGSLLAHNEAMRRRCESLQAQLRSARLERKPSAQGASTYDLAASTMALWVCLNLDDHRLGPMSTYVLELMPDLFDAFQLRDNEELSSTAHDVLVQVASFPFSEVQVPALVDCLLRIARSSNSWHSRLDALPFLQIVYFQKYVCTLLISCSLPI